MKVLKNVATLILFVFLLSGCANSESLREREQLMGTIEDLQNEIVGLNEQVIQLKQDASAKKSDEEFASQLLVKIEKYYNSDSWGESELAKDYMAVFSNEFMDTTSYKRVQEITNEMNNVTMKNLEEKSEDLSAKISLSEYNKIEIGITYTQLKKIIGGSGNVLSESINTIMYMYEGEGSLGANANFMFQDGKLLNKAQLGLE